jgi:hypothetical protein
LPFLITEIKYFQQITIVNIVPPFKKRHWAFQQKRVSLIFKKTGSDDERNGAQLVSPARTRPRFVTGTPCVSSIPISKLLQKLERDRVNYLGDPANISAMSWQTKEDASPDQSSAGSRPRWTVLLMLLLFMMLQLLLLLFR